MEREAFSLLLDTKLDVVLGKMKVSFKELILCQFNARCPNSGTQFGDVRKSPKSKTQLTIVDCKEKLSFPFVR